MCSKHILMQVYLEMTGYTKIRTAHLALINIWWWWWFNCNNKKRNFALGVWSPVSPGDFCSGSFLHPRLYR